MWIKFCISLFLSWLIHQVKCIDRPYSDMYLPDGTDGFVCETKFFSIDYARQVARAVIGEFFFGKYFQNYPTLFEDRKLFNVKSDIFLSWPAKPRETIFTGNPGKFRLIVNIRGQIMGIVIKDINHHNNQVSFEKCKPVRRSIAEDNIESRLLDEFWRIAFPRYGFNCGSRYFPLSTVKSGNDLDSNYYFQNILEDKDKLTYFEKYKGDQFIGDNLRLYPLHHSSDSKLGSGPFGFFRVVFDKKDHDFKGIINLIDSEAKCVSVWDLSSPSPDTIYRPSSIFNMERMPDKDWPKTCAGRRFKYKTIWLYIEFALKDWSANWDGRELNFPIVEQNGLNFWPVRIPETNNKSMYNAFAIGHDTKKDVYGLYQADLRNGALINFQKCLDIPLREIRNLQGKLRLAKQL
uniref:BgtE-40003 n=1 Tax=Blumeria graminis f. sp. tritici 96224 TaxID=1268274 RepID=A0A381L3R4_BLUGR